jgi:N-acetylglutamate synthase-like GNAT family acetyltransferase
MIRQFRPEDAPSCSRLIHACLQNDASFSPALRQRIQSVETPESIAERARLFYVAVYESESQILGIVGLDMNEVRILCVSPAHQRRGIGRALLEHVKTMAPGELFSDVFVYSSIPAVDFYRACGFVERGPFSFDIGGEPLHTIFMTFPAR